MSGPSKDFLLDPGTNGFIATPFNLMTTELNSVANGNSALSSVGGTSGVFSQSNFDNEMLYEVYFVAGGSISSIAAGGNISGWWCKSTDGGTTFEKTVSNTAFPRPPDLLIPLDASYSSSDIRFGLIAPCPWPSAKLFVINNSGQTLPSSGNKILAAPVGWGY
jgi:hypothetical protein